MSVLGSFIKQPAEVETYSIDYSDDLTTSDRLTTATCTVSPIGLLIDYCTVIDNATDHRVRVKLSGGVLGVRHKVTITTNTEDDRTMQDEFYVRIKDY